MKTMTLNRFTVTLPIAVLLCLLAIPVQADFNWASVTLDNDLFIGEDSGYTNGIFISLYEVEGGGDQTTKPDFWVAPLLWSIPQEKPVFAINSYTLDQTLATPSDISLENPPEDELPYAAMLSLTNTYLSVTPSYADSVSTTIGIVGPAAQGEKVQKFFHKTIRGIDPKGWDTQLKNEPVFQFKRTRTWRNWVSQSGHFDFLSGLELSLGTIQSGVEGSAYLRYGRNLMASYATTLLQPYATTLLNNARATNPLSVKRGWQLYAGLKASYTFNVIFADGNTFRDSRSVDYNRESLGVTAGLAYSWSNCSLTFAVTDTDILKGNKLENLSRFGTLTFAWRL